MVFLLLALYSAGIRSCAVAGARGCPDALYEAGGLLLSGALISTRYVPGRRPFSCGIWYWPFAMWVPEAETFSPPTEANRISPSSSTAPFSVIFPLTARRSDRGPQPETDSSEISATADISEA